MLNSSELINLRQTGTCNISIPEIAFEIYYPGQYRRMIKSVRVTIPSVVGPYTNVSAKLTLLNGKIKKEENAVLEDYAIGKNTSINTSGALNDAGMFDFNFRDERYLPFEGGGAISEWQLNLPSKIRAFNYDTISDVLLTISYTAIEGNRITAENNLVSNLTDYCASNGMFRLLSLKHEFPDTYHKLLYGTPQSAEFTLESSHFPFFIKDKILDMTKVNIYLKPQPGVSLTPHNIIVNETNIDWSSEADIVCPWSNNTIIAGSAGFTGSPIKKWIVDAGVNGLNKDELDDILILIKYKI
jgi:hypothetical protein